MALSIKRPQFLNSSIFVVFYLTLLILCCCNSENTENNKTLTPYVYQHGSHLNHSSIRECHLEKLGTEPHELQFAHVSVPPAEHFLEVKRFVKEFQTNSGSRIIRGHYALILDPLRTLSVLEPNQRGGCNQNIRQTVEKSALQKHCLLAVNAGYFNTSSGACLGNIVSDGRLVKDSGGIQNAHFGLKKDGSIFTGYLAQAELLSNDPSNFLQLVGGVGMILKEGKEFVNFSKLLECESTEETGSMDAFVNILSARMAIGHDKNGKVIIVQVDGKSGQDGASLWDMQKILKEFGVINAINLDGGGSATFVLNAIVTNYPYDACHDKSGGFSCSREVSTILCVHEPYCEPEDCNDHGHCIMGKCICEKNWLPPRCDRLSCMKNNCSSHGICSAHGCLCEPGWMGEDCGKRCENGWFGQDCKTPCHCMNNSTCDIVSGHCICKPGFSGSICQHECPLGYFGINCYKKCSCNNSCFCDPVTGACDKLQNYSIYLATQCISALLKEENVRLSDTEDIIQRTISMDILSVITAVSISCCLLLLFFSCTCYCRSRRRLCFKNKKKFYKDHLPLRTSEKDCSDSSSENETIFINPSAKS